MNTTSTLPAADAAALLIDTVRELSSIRTLDAITNVVKRTARQMAGADGATFVLRDVDKCYYFDEDAISPLWKGRKFPLEACISGWAMLYRRQVIIRDIYVDDRIPHDAYRPTFVKSLTMTPIRTLEPWGAIGVYWAHEHEPSPDEAGWLQALADSTAVAMENVRAHEELHAVPAPPGTTSGDLVKMCAWTKRLQIDGEWVSMEVYLKRHFGLEVSHGISEEALQSVGAGAARSGRSPIARALAQLLLPRH